jgi:transposase
MKPYRYITLSIQEVETLEEGLKHHAKSFYRTRCHALLLSQRRYKVMEIASLLQVRSHTVRLWMSNWEANGLAGLQISTGRGRKAVIMASDVDLVAQIQEQLRLNPQSLASVCEQLNQANALSLTPGQLLRFIKKS